MHFQLLRRTTAVHLNQFRAISVSSIKSRVQWSHRVTLASSESSVNSCAVIQENFARVQMTVQSRNVKRRLAVVRSDVQRARSLFRQPFYQLDPTGCDGLVSNARASYGSGVKRTTVLSQNLQGFQLAFSRGAERWSEGVSFFICR